MKHIFITILISCLLTGPLTIAHGWECQQGKKQSDKEQGTEATTKAKDDSLEAADAREQAENRSWISKLDTPVEYNQSEAVPLREEKKKELTYSNYSFLFQLFYKYSLSDFFEAPSFRDEKKNNFEHWTIDLEEHRRRTSEWVAHWGRKLYQNLKQ